jgi:ATP-dependent protease ClpP protease subunit
VPGWKDIAAEIAGVGINYEAIRRKYLGELFAYTDRNVIIYYSGWLQKQHLAPFVGGAFALSDVDKSAFMATIHDMDRTKGLDLILHTPGGDAAATESLVHYLHEMFDHNIRAIVPQLALSAGTMIACACKEIIMGAHSSLGPIDPQFNGVPAHGVVEEFERARTEIAASPANIALWQPIIAKYNPTFIGECEKALKWSREIAEDWLRTGMFAGKPNAAELAAHVVEALGDHEEQRSHARHISLRKALDIGLNVVPLEADKRLQDLILSIHHTVLQAFYMAPQMIKLVENQFNVGIQTNLSLQANGPPIPPSPATPPANDAAGSASSAGSAKGGDRKRSSKPRSKR